MRRTPRLITQLPIVERHHQRPDGHGFDRDDERALHEALRPVPIDGRGVQDVAS